MKQQILAGILFGSVAIGAPLGAQSVNFGDNTSDYASDGECDDRRFIGTGPISFPSGGMAAALDRADTGRDAADCKRLYDAGLIALVSEARGRSITQCAQIDFGLDDGDWTGDGECDDPRFDGPGSAATIASGDVLRDARDCLAACERGAIWLRAPEE